MLIIYGKKRERKYPQLFVIYLYVTIFFIYSFSRDVKKDPRNWESECITKQEIITFNIHDNDDTIEKVGSFKFLGNFRGVENFKFLLEKGGEVKYKMAARRVRTVYRPVHNARSRAGSRSCELHTIVAGSVNFPSPRRKPLNYCVITSSPGPRPRFSKIVDEWSGEQSWLPPPFKYVQGGT